MNRYSIIPERDDSNLEQGGDSSMEKWLNSEYILYVEPIGCEDDSDIVWEKERGQRCL